MSRGVLPACVALASVLVGPADQPAASAARAASAAAARSESRLMDMTAGTLRVGDTLPRLEGSFLTGRDAVLPDAARGHIALLAIGFTYKSRFAVEPWTEWFRREFGKSPNMTFFEIPVVGGMAKMGRWFIDRGMRNGTPPELHEHVITVYRGAGDWKKRVGHTEAGNDYAYLIVLDHAGVVRWTARGPFEAARTADVRTVITELEATAAAHQSAGPAGP